MKMSRIVPALCACLLLCSCLHAQPVSAKVSTTFKIKAPASTPADAKVYLSGGAKALGAWKADGAELKKTDDGTWSATVELPASIPVEYKVTRGTWETVEKNVDGSEADNRTFTPTADSTIEVEVAAWADKPAEKPADKSPAKPIDKPVDAPAVKPAPPVAIKPSSSPTPPPPARIQSTATGDIRTHKFHSRLLKNDRAVYVYLPPGYQQNTTERYAVLYMHDGQNLFDRLLNPVGEWQADETAARLIAEKKIEPLIIVGIANTAARMSEYTLARDPRMNAGGDGEAYIRFVCGEVKPFIDRTYRTKTDRDHTGVGGSSLGANISLEMCRQHPELFGRCAVISPALWWNNGDTLRRLQTDTAWIKGSRVWIDLGAAEAPPDQEKALINTVNILAEILRAGGAQKDKDFKLEIIEGATHIEGSWAKRFDQVLTFLFPASP